MYSGKKLIEETTSLVYKLLPNLTIETVRYFVVDSYSTAEYFDGEPVNPEWFAGKVVERMKWKGAV
jgi:hypothetical protein